MEKMDAKRTSRNELSRDYISRKEEYSKRNIILLIVSLALFVLMLNNGFIDIVPFKSIFSTRKSTAEYHQHFIRIPSPEMAKIWLHEYTKYPHIAGEKENKVLAQLTMEKWKSFGIPDVKLQTYYPLLNYPGKSRVSVIHPEDRKVQLELREDAIDEDPTSVKYRDSIPPFHGYSAHGNVTGRLVYVNYGRLEDFDALKNLGVDFTGTVALVKYGKNFRGLKVRAAEINGCSGAIVFSDPHEDGYTRGPVYPEGPWRPDSSVQRGSVHYMSLYPGDPLTPGYPATEDAQRIPKENASTLPTIPSIPISYRDAKKLLLTLKGEGYEAANIADDWVGDLDIEYWTGPGQVLVNLFNDVKYEIRPIYNVIGTIKGEVEPERYVVLGNHRDAWTMGGVDPNSGTSALMEIARGFGNLMKEGWKPRRTVVFASWDGEEYGMLGSTEFVEDKSNNVKKNVVAYLNVDTAVSGNRFFASATPSLSQVIRQVTKMVSDPNTGKKLYRTWLEQQKAWKPEQKIDDDEEFPKSTFSYQKLDRPYVGQLGSGSDFVGFVDFCGVASTNFAFRGKYGVYHSNYDSFHWMEKFGDPSFEYHAISAQVWGLLGLKLSDSPLIPFNYSEYADELEYYVNNLEKKAVRLSLPILRSSIDELRWAASIIESKQKNLAQEFALFSTKFNLRRTLEDKLYKINEKLYFAERFFLDPQGIPGRTWFKHVVFAPGLWAGYGASTFPSLAEAIDSANKGFESWDNVKVAENSTASYVIKVAEFLKS